MVDNPYLGACTKLFGFSTFRHPRQRSGTGIQKTIAVGQLQGFLKILKLSYFSSACSSLATQFCTDLCDEPLLFRVGLSNADCYKGRQALDRVKSWAGFKMAERVGFEPTCPDQGTTRFRVGRVTAGLRYLSAFLRRRKKLCKRAALCFCRMPPSTQKRLFSQSMPG